MSGDAAGRVLGVIIFIAAVGMIVWEVVQRQKEHRAHRRWLLQRIREARGDDDPDRDRSSTRQEP